MPAHKLHMCVLICQRQLAAVCMHACMQCSLKVVGVNRIVLKVAGVSRMFVGGYRLVRGRHSYIYLAGNDHTLAPACG